MTKEERNVIGNALVCILQMLKLTLSKERMKDKELINAAFKYIESTEKQVEEFRQC